MMDLLSVIDGFAGLKVLVIGDAMLDCYLHGVSDRLSQEAPVPVVNICDRTDLPGGAANTAVNVASLGGTVDFLSVTGTDREGTLLRQALERQGIATDHVLSVPARQTLAKHRLIATQHMLARFDQGSTEPIDAETEALLIETLSEQFAGSDAVIVSDYGYGILTPRLIQVLAVLQMQTPRILVVDSKALLDYRCVQATAVKPNYAEITRLLGSRATDDRVAFITSQRDRILDLTNARIVAVTLDKEGALVCEWGKPPYRTYTCPVVPVQTTGAGDTYLSSLTLALAAGANTPIAAELAAIAATVVVSKQGTSTCTVRELRDAIAAKSPIAPASAEPRSRHGAVIDIDLAREMA